MKLKTGLAAALFVAAGVSPSMADTRLVVNCFWPPQHMMCKEILPGWLDQIETATEGRVRGNIPPKSVAPPPEQLAWVSGPLVAMNPFVGSYKAPAMAQALWETNRQFFPDEFDTTQLLSQWAITPGELFSSTDEPILTLEDFASRKIWALPGPLSNMSVALGAGVVSTPAVGSNEVISRGVVDGHLGMSGDALAAFQLLPYTKSLTRFSRPIYSTAFNLVMNKDKWDGISPEDQAAIMELSGATFGMHAAQMWDDAAERVFGQFADLGIATYDVDPGLEAAFVAAAAPIEAAWVVKATAAGIDGQAALDFYKQRVIELSK